MDLLMSCATNVRVVDDVFQTYFYRFKSKDRSTEHGDLYHALSELRKQNILCALVDKEVYIFGRKDEESDRQQLLDVLGDAYMSEHCKIMGNDLDTRFGEGRMLKDVFLDAIESTVSFTLAHQQSLLPVESCQWLYCPVDGQETNDTSTLVRLHLNLTDNGTLYFSTAAHTCSLGQVRDTGSPLDVTLVPSGRRARLNPDGHAQESNGNTALENDTWQHAIVRILGAEGLDLHTDDEWTTAELLDEDEKYRVLWPTRLCLASRPSCIFGHRPNWKNWFSDPTSTESPETYQNPLGEAEEWFGKYMQRSNDVDDTAPSAENPYTSTSVVNDRPLATSPPFNQRIIDHHAAMSGIYPTPPDGLMPAHTLNQHSTSDDTLRAEQSNESNQVLGSDDTQHQSLGSSTQLQSYQPDSLEVDDLFGDMGSVDDFDPLGANEVGEADFDYFDDPDYIGPANSGDAEADENVEKMEVARVEEEIEPQQDDDIGHHLESPGANILSVPEAWDDSEPSFGRASAMSQTIEQPAAMDDPEAVRSRSEDPLSPFRIRERLLPPPIPASAGPRTDRRRQRSRTFDPIVFNDGLANGSSHYVRTQYTPQNDGYNSKKPNIGLPHTRKKRRLREEHDTAESEYDRMEASHSSEGDSPDGSTSVGESDDDILTLQFPWLRKKRKLDSLAIENSTSLPERSVLAMAENYTGSRLPEEALMRLCAILTSSGTRDETSHDQKRLSSTKWARAQDTERSDSRPGITEIVKLSKLDILYTAQIVTEQATTTTTKPIASIEHHGHVERSVTSSISSTLEALASDAVRQIFPNSAECGLAKLAMTREALPRPSNSSTSGHLHNPQPRAPHVREGSSQLGPDCFSIPAPYIHIQRGAEPWEMLPPALSFWSALGLAPASGPKDVKALCVIPDSEDLAFMARDFMVELGRAYETCKLGNFGFAGPIAEEPGSLIEEFSDAVIAVKSEGGASLGLAGLLSAYAAAFTVLGRALAKIGHADHERHIVVCILNPFEECATAQQHLCACFCQLYKAYRDSAPKAHRSAQRSDLVLQILPISSIASMHGMVMLDSHQMSLLATEIYDRCPPSPNAALDSSSVLPILAAPAVELASVPPKRIGFQLTSDPPSDLLHEGSILHLAYSISVDSEWMTACWMDGTARYQRTMSASLRGKSFESVATEIWVHTMEIIASREVTWRVFIVASQNMDESVRNCWRTVVGTKPRKQMLHVTLLALKDDPILQLSPSASAQLAKTANNVSTPRGGFLTPVSTPQGTALAMSPEANGQHNAPPTPAPSDTVASTIEADPDAYLIDLADESWAMLVAHPLRTGKTTGSTRSATSGLLFRRGESSHGHMDALGLELYWEIRVRSNGLVDEVPQRQCEANLREVLKMYRSLSLLAKLRGIDGKEDHGERKSLFMPVHVLHAIKGAESLNELLS